MIHNGIAKIDNTPNKLSITIPSKKNWFVLIFATAWLGGWYFGFQNALSELLSDGIDNLGTNGFMLFWFIGWTVGGVAVISMLLWGYFGQEQFNSDNGEVYLSKTVFGLGIKHRIEANEIKNIKTEFANENMFGSNRWTWRELEQGKIKFDYGLKTFSFGLGVDDAEADYIVELMKKHFKR